MSQPYRVEGRRSETDIWLKLGRHKTVRDARTAARAFEETGGQARVRGPGGKIIEFFASELTPDARTALEDLIRHHPEGLGPGVSVDDALRTLRDGAQGDS